MSTTPERIWLSPPQMGGAEEKYVAEAFASNFIAPLGPQLNAFEEAFREYTGFAACCAVSSGTAAMHLLLRELGIGAGDRVLASTLTFIGSVSPITFQGAVPVFVDADRETWNIDPDLVAAEIERALAAGEPLPKAVVPTDLYGQSADLHRLRDICDPHGIPIVADCAESLGATLGDRHAGCDAHAAVISFNGNKIITTSGGGMVASDDEQLINRCRHLATQAREPFAHFEHLEVGYNYRMSNVVAAIGLGQLEVLDERVAGRRAIFDGYVERLGDLDGVEFMPEADYGKSNRWLTVLTLDPDTCPESESIRLALEEENIESRPLWKPMHQQPAFAGAEVIGGEVSDDLFLRGLCLPSGGALTEDDLDRVSSIVRKCHATR